MPYENDPGRYRKLSAPLESTDAAKDAISRFWDMVRDARLACGIADVHVIVRVSALATTGEEGVIMTSMNIGDVMLGESMCAYGYGQESLMRESTMGRYLAGKWGE